MSNECTWINNDDDPCYYETSCGEAFNFFTGEVKENGFKFCPYCGSKIDTIKEASDE
jgi:DNA-directed RNA polymerase subunit RPC12/RpoP